MADFLPFVISPIPEDEQLARAREFHQLCGRRRTIREFSDQPVSTELLELLIKTAGTAPSGANKQPWRFVIVTDPRLKHDIRLAAEAEEQESYEHRMSQEWLDDLAVLGTDWHKEFLEVAPALIVVFSISHVKEKAVVKKNYYVKESVGIAVGFLLAAIHNAGLVALTHTPSPMDFLPRILGRPENEKPYVLIPVGYPKQGTMVPNIQRKGLGEILLWNLSADSGPTGGQS